METLELDMIKETLKNAVAYLERIANAEKKLIPNDVLKKLTVRQKEEGFYNETLPRILLFGKFKSGKSTLLNALAGRHLAATDLFEKTAWIARYWSDDREFCYIHMNDGSIQESSVDTFVEYTEMDKYPLEYLSKIRRIDIGYNGIVPFAVIDTPGIGSMNKENENRALEAIDDADMILFVTDCNRIGDQRETALMQEIKKSGVPMLCVASQYDGDITYRKSPEDIKKMVASFTPFEESEIIPVSALKYLEMPSDPSSNMQALFEVCNNLKIRNEILRENAGKARLYRLMNDILCVLYDTKRELVKLQGIRAKFEKEYIYISGIVQTKLSLFIKEYIGKTLYVEYKPAIIETLKLLKQNHAPADEVGTVLQRVLPPDYMNRYWEKLMNVVSKKMSEFWKENSSSLGNSGGEAFSFDTSPKDTIQNIDMGFLSGLTRFGDDEELVDKGVKLAFKVAGAMTFYQAVLGANAAAITITGAALSTGLPIVLLGIGLTNYIVRSRADTSVGEIDIEEIVDRHIREFAESISVYCLENISRIEKQHHEFQLARFDKELMRSLPYQSSCEEENRLCENWVEKLETMKDTIHPDLSEVNELSGIIKELRKQLETLKMDLASEKLISQEYNQRLKNNKSHIEDLQDQNRKMEENLKKEKIRAEKAEENRKQAKEETDNLQKRLDSEEKRFKELKKKLDAKQGTEDELFRLQKEKDEVDRKLSEIREKEEKARKELIDAELNLRNSEESVRKLENIVSQNETKISGLQNENTELHGRLGYSENRIQTLEDKLADINKNSNSGSIAAIFENNKKLIEMHLEELKNIAVDEIPKQELALCIEDDQSGNAVMNLLTEINRNGIKPLRTNKNKVDDKSKEERIDEIETEFGIVFVLRKKKNRIINIDFNEKYATNELLQLLIKSAGKKSQILQDQEIRDTLYELVKNTKSYLYIAIPNINSTAGGEMLERMLDNLRNNPNKNVSFKILWGLNDKYDPRYDGYNEKLEKTRKEIRKYKSNLGGNFSDKETNTHIKLVICDDDCYLLGSMNYLSFYQSYEDNTDERVHHELCQLSYDKELLSELKNIYFNW